MSTTTAAVRHSHRVILLKRGVHARTRYAHGLRFMTFRCDCGAMKTDVDGVDYRTGKGILETNGWHGGEAQ